MRVAGTGRVHLRACIVQNEKLPLREVKKRLARIFHLRQHKTTAYLATTPSHTRIASHDNPEILQ